MTKYGGVRAIVQGAVCIRQLRKPYPQSFRRCAARDESSAKGESFTELQATTTEYLR